MGIFRRRGMIAVIPISGVLSMRSVEPIIELIERVERMKKVRGVLVRLSSQGGSITATEVLYQALVRLREKKRLFVWTVLAASGGYYAACAGEKIYAPGSAIIGSIGVISIKPVVSGVMKKLGLKVEVTKEGRLKDDSLFFKESTAEGKKKMQAINRAVYEDFVGLVAKERKLDIKKVREIATGEILLAKRGKDLGLVDDICDLRAAREALAREVGVDPERVIFIKPKKPLLASIVERGLLSGFRGFFEEIFSPEIYY